MFSNIKILHSHKRYFYTTVAEPTPDLAASSNKAQITQRDQASNSSICQYIRLRQSVFKLCRLIETDAKSLNSLSCQSGHSRRSSETSQISITSGSISFQENAEEEGNVGAVQLDAGISDLLRGTKRYRIVLVVDKGYDVFPKNVKKDRISKLLDQSVENT